MASSEDVMAGESRALSHPQSGHLQLNGSHKAAQPSPGEEVVIFPMSCVPQCVRRAQNRITECNLQSAVDMCIIGQLG